VGQSCRSGPTAEQIDNQLALQLPVGSTETQVTTFLDAQRIEHSEILKHPENESDFRELKLDNKSRVEGFMIGMIRNTDQRGLVTGNIQIYLYFDNKGFLVARSVKWVGTSM